MFPDIGNGLANIPPTGVVYGDIDADTGGFDAFAADVDEVVLETLYPI